MEKLNVVNNESDPNEHDSDSESLLSENEILFSFLYPNPSGTGYPIGTTD